MSFKTRHMTVHVQFISSRIYPFNVSDTSLTADKGLTRDGMPAFILGCIYFYVKKVRVLNTLGWSLTGTTTLTATLIGLSLVMSTILLSQPPLPPSLSEKINYINKKIYIFIRYMNVTKHSLFIYRLLIINKYRTQNCGKVKWNMGLLLIWRTSVRYGG